MIKNITFGCETPDNTYRFPVIDKMTDGKKETYISIVAYDDTVVMDVGKRRRFSFPRDDWRHMMGLFETSIEQNCKLMLQTDKLNIILRKEAKSNGIIWVPEKYTLAIADESDTEFNYIIFDEEVINKIISIGRWI